jgi:CheY-like chemotaxis protein
MGGTIDVSSRPGAGSTFTVRVTLGRSREPVGAVQPVGGSDTAVQSLPPGTRVLVAEDDAISQRVVSGMLEALGASVTPVSDGRDALDAFSAGAFDLVLMDGQMPSMDGWEAAKAIRALEARRGGRTPVIALTANVMTTDRERCLAAGMDDMLSKPLQRAALARLLDKWCGAPARDKR